MIAIDTNVLVRLLTADHPAQFKASQKLFSSEIIFILDSVVLETEWVLRAAYDMSPSLVCETLRRVFGLPNVMLTNPQRMAQVIFWHEGGLDFADAFHLAASQDCSVLKTFDLDFIKRAKSIDGCDVEKVL